jgi:tartrate dehydratase alpha subunit/fumarate hydratase class I-like protein
MGRDKALLPAGRNTLREEIDAGVRKATADVMLNHSLPHKPLKRKDFLEPINTAKWPMVDATLPRNVNTPEEWRARDLRS